MWYPAALSNDEAPAEPLTTAEVRAQSRIDFADDDDYIATLISAARDHIEHYCNIRVAANVISVKCDAFADFAWFPEGPLQGVSLITYIDTTGDMQTLSTDVYEVRADGVDALIALKYAQAWPAIQSGSRITVTATVGYGAAPPAIKRALLLYVAEAYEQRENSNDTGWSAVDTLLSNFRRGA